MVREWWMDPFVVWFVGTTKTFIQGRWPRPTFYPLHERCPADYDIRYKNSVAIYEGALMNCDLPCRWRQQVSPKRLLVCARHCDVAFRKTVYVVAWCYCRHRSVLLWTVRVMKRHHLVNYVRVRSWMALVVGGLGLEQSGVARCCIHHSLH